MCLFKYREKRYGKRTFVLFALVVVALAVASIAGGIFAVTKMTHWSKYVIVAVCSIIGLGLGFWGIFMLALSPSLINKKQSVKDGNKAKGIADIRLCDMCGRQISKVAEFCEHCGQKQQTGLGMRTCPHCKTKNSATAEFCEKCGSKFE